MKNGQGPNLVIGDSTPQNIGLVIETGKVLPLDTFLSDPKSTITKSNFTAGMLSTGTFKGTLYTLPTDVGDYAIVYNKKMFADAGITSTPTTWSQLAADAAKLTKGTTQYGIYLPISSGEWPVFTWQSMLWGAGGEFLNADNTKVEFNSQAGVDALTAWVDLIKNHSAYPQSLFSSTNNGGTAALTAKKAAMAYDGAYNLATLDKALGAGNVGVFAVPGLKQPGMNLGTDNSYLLKGTTATEQGSWQFLQYWLKPSVQAKWDIATGYFPSNSEHIERSHVEELPGEESADSGVRQGTLLRQGAALDHELQRDQQRAEPGPDRRDDGTEVPGGRTERRGHQGASGLGQGELVIP